MPLNVSHIQLRDLAVAAQQLGSSSVITSTCYRLRGRLANIISLYKENAARLFPGKVSRITVPRVQSLEIRAKRRRGVKTVRYIYYKTLPHMGRVKSLDPETFPKQLEMLSEDLAEISSCLGEFRPETTLDDGIKVAIQTIQLFEGDLKYWSNCLYTYTGQFRKQFVRKYLHDLSNEMGEHIDNTIASVSEFKEVGIRTIRYDQKHRTANFPHISTIATLLSIVSAMSTQLSFNQVGNLTADLVKCFWFASLVFSIAAAMNSLLGLTWRQAIYRSPYRRVPWLILFWIKYSPLVFLDMWLVCFSTGLCLFAYSSGQPLRHFSQHLHFLDSVVSAWFVLERWVFIRHSGQKWLSDVPLEKNDRFMSMHSITILRKSSLRVSI
ncbi:hypothetical protein BDQ17DRAFT_1429310 [Cyathus striatus]|nr:hypothetical protein BDQ17DRAFT_1429310 [Cyathus striatus]